ncbi:hypothetical protein F3Y22_tig00012523pilonHSYRG00181 [Hibiscus syriacus]|uniref:Chromo domain-containing protein n=1 Tax=Hibiscus syriacus TaxID=106335 RepID=A0A6A3C2D7_HIBSY|nr:hypothetical protein F3Y22_tig00012523pilonHSYRG00181 [Hibiscus syriacus]
MAYKLDLPQTIRAHPVLHVSLLKSFHPDKDDLDQSISHRAPVGIKASYKREVKVIQSERANHRVGHKPRHEYLVQWNGLPEKLVGKNVTDHDREGESNTHWCTSACSIALPGLDASGGAPSLSQNAPRDAPSPHRNWIRPSLP